jgi:hypothetical protein
LLGAQAGLQSEILFWISKILHIVYRL